LPQRFEHDCLMRIIRELIEAPPANPTRIFREHYAVVTALLRNGSAPFARSKGNGRGKKEFR
jgi:hypothetical protein